jgi:hypothetical protein
LKHRLERRLRAEVLPPTAGWSASSTTPMPSEHAAPDGTFGNRFDDPKGEYRVLYAGQQLAHVGRL